MLSIFSRRKSLRHPYSNKYRVGGEITLAVLPHHRAYGSVHGGSRSVLKTMELIHVAEQSSF